MRAPDAFRHVLREMPSKGWLEVSDCRHGTLRQLLTPGRRYRSHESFVVLLMSSRPSVKINQQRLAPDAARTIALIGPGSLWQALPGADDSVTGEDGQLWSCRASPVWRSSAPPSIAPGIALVSEEGTFARYEEQLSTLYHEHLDSLGEFRRGLCSSLFHSLAAEIVLNASGFARPSYTRSDVLRLCGEIRAQPAKRFQLSELAELAGLSPRQLRRVFVSELGKTPKEFEIESRMVHAEFLLTSLGLKVHEVAEACGYSDPFLFSRQFKELRSRNPRTLRPGFRANAVRNRDP